MTDKQGVSATRREELIEEIAATRFERESDDALLWAETTEHWRDVYRSASAPDADAVLSLFARWETETSEPDAAPKTIYTIRRVPYTAGAKRAAGYGSVDFEYVAESASSDSTLTVSATPGYAHGGYKGVVS